LIVWLLIVAVVDRFLILFLNLVNK
jgi:hypothetical protein